MSLVQEIKNGSFLETVGTTSAKKEKANGGQLDKEDFLKLLVAEMQYQDPLEPQSNTDYVAQLATFTQVEASENMVGTMEQMQANDLIGKTVIMKTTSSATGDTNYVTGTVDSVVKEGQNVYLQIAGNLYNIDDLDTVADPEYMTAVTMSNTFRDLVAALPKANDVNLGHEAQIESIRHIYDGLTDYQKAMINQEDLKAFSEVENRLKALQALRDAIANDAENKTDKVNKVDETEEIDEEEEIDDDEVDE